MELEARLESEELLSTRPEQRESRTSFLLAHSQAQLCGSVTSSIHLG